MKYNITRKELKECIAKAVTKVLREDYNEFDDFETDDFDEFDDIYDPEAEKAASKDAEIENGVSRKKSKKADIIPDDEDDEDAFELDTFDDEDNEDEDEMGNDNGFITKKDAENMQYEELLDIVNTLPKSSNKFKIANSELSKRKDIKNGDYPIYGYMIDDNGNVQPKFKQLGTKNNSASVFDDFIGDHRINSWGGQN